ncbi:energy transducer TonB [Nafulsella turpanensis]|uniref:energy transducer TonB n=1 Tax=Nafulsella turpanensis TaxID=1265690 RepID=UPI00034CB0E7|nr:energy transducer TonB [Nafulsella turpanensis]
MEPKKNPKADLTRKSNLFFAIGLVVSIMLVIVAFEWKSYDEVVAVDMGVAADNFEELIDIPITEQPPPPPPKIQQPEIIEVPDEEVIEEEIELDIDLEVVEEDVVEEIVFEEAPEEEPVEQIFEVVEQQPTPEGGMEAFYKFIAEELEYPAQAQRMGVEGRVFVQFVVDEKGNVSDVKAVKGIGAGADEEAVRVIKQTKWNPGMQRGRPVKVRMVMPVLFRLSN